MTLAPARAPANAQAHNALVSAIRVLDLIVGCAALIVSGPIMLLVALAIWMGSGRPVFFTQVRLGRLGRHFRMYKFRKFRREIGSTGPGVTLKEDRRMTRVGRFLGRTKLDELPQLWNILRGDMSIVGPRPESLRFADCFQQGYLRVLDYKPGIFGPNQFYFRDEASLYPDEVDPDRFYREVLFPLKANIDLAYFPHRTFSADVGWIIRCILAVFGMPPSPAQFNAVLAGWLDQQEVQAPDIGSPVGGAGKAVHRERRSMA
jgi:lipopolysaccharide/colanic/teichoic acid biosynthesis glycosyltransferase